MCTLVAAFRHFSGLPLVLAANRDERYDRPSSPIRLWPEERLLAPRDEAAGGTWLGLNANGLFVGVTNRFGVPRDGTRSSRGALVLEALRASSARDLHASLATLPLGRFNAFHLFYADAQDAFVTWADASSLQQSTLLPGLHIITERSLGGDDRARTELVRERMHALEVSGNLRVEALFAIMRIHADAHALMGTCVHVPEVGYGTRSSMVLLVAEKPGDSALYWAEGSPCRTAYEDQSRLLAMLARTEG